MQPGSPSTEHTKHIIFGCFGQDNGHDVPNEDDRVTIVDHAAEGSRGRSMYVELFEGEFASLIAKYE